MFAVPTRRTLAVLVGLMLLGLVGLGVKQASAATVWADNGTLYHVVSASQGYASPTGNIRCTYASQVGITCRTLNNGRWVVLESWTGVVSPGRGQLGTLVGGRPIPYRTVPYGRTIAVGGSFRIQSSRDGFDVWSAITGGGFSINRTYVYPWQM